MNRTGEKIGGTAMEFETFSIDISEQPPQVIVLRLAGEFDLVSEPALQEALDGLPHGSGCSLVVDVSEAPFMGVGSLRRIVLAGRGFASTEFRSPVHIVERVLQLLGFLDGTVGIDRATSRAVTASADEIASMGRRNEPPRLAPEKESPALLVSRQCSEVAGALKLGVFELGRSGVAVAGQDECSPPRSLDHK
jgi:hypothetical protein